MKKALIIQSESVCEKASYKLIDAIPVNQYDLIGILGTDCEEWEEIVDETIVGHGSNIEPLPVTTSHPGESIFEVKEFVMGFFQGEGTDVQIIRI